MSTELARLSDYEARAEEAVKQVNRGMEDFAVELKAIKDLGLWKGGYDTFEDYCITRWSRTVRTVQRALQAHTTRQKLLAVATPAEKPVVEQASTKAIVEAASAPEDQQMSHLVIGRNKPTATRTADFYSSGPVGIAEMAKDGDRMIASASAHYAAIIEAKEWPAETQPMFNAETADRMAAVRVIRDYPLKDEAHRNYLKHLADKIEKGEPA